MTKGQTSRQNGKKSHNNNGKDSKTGKTGKSCEDYADIIDLPHPVSKRHLPMSRQKRAAQFSAFAALSDYDEIIAEAEKAGAAWNTTKKNGQGTTNDPGQPS